MANGAEFAEAVKLAKTVPQLSVGCHIVLIDGKPVLAPGQVSTLIYSRSQSGSFRASLRNFAMRAMSGRISGDQIEAEAMAQIQKLQSSGVPVSHVDTHKYTHVFREVLRPLLRAARACGIRALRNPFGPGRPWVPRHVVARPGLWSRFAQLRLLWQFAEQFRESVEQASLVTPDGALGIEVTGVLDENLFRTIAEYMPEGTWEFVCHPGYNDADLQTARTRLRESRESELRALTLPQTREILQRSGIALISYRDFVGGQ